MGRGRAKAKQTKVARRLKYSSPNMDLNALQQELAGTSHAHDDEVDDDFEYEEYEDYVDPTRMSSTTKATTLMRTGLMSRAPLRRYRTLGAFGHRRPALTAPYPSRVRPSRRHRCRSDARPHVAP